MTEPSDQLTNLQQWMMSVITEPDGIEAGLGTAQPILGISPAEVERVILPSKALDSRARLRVYGNAYYARLVECLGDEFPAVKVALGEETFDAFAFSYLQDYPSQSYTLGELGRRFSLFLSETRPEDLPEKSWADFLIDLARLEWIYSEIFNGPGIEQTSTLQPDDLTGLDEQAFVSARLVPVPCLRLEQFDFPVHEYATAVRKRDESPELPAASPTWLMITRKDYVVRRTPVSEAEYRLLEELIRGASVGEALEQQSDQFAEEMQQNLAEWFRRWAAAGYFLRVESD